MATGGKLAKGTSCPARGRGVGEGGVMRRGESKDAKTRTHTDQMAQLKMDTRAERKLTTVRDRSSHMPRARHELVTGGF